MLNSKSGNTHNGNTMSLAKKVQHPLRSNRPKSNMDYRRPSDCLFCEDDCRKIWKEKFNVIMNQALYSKYSFSQNYFYTKDINEVFCDARTTFVTLYKDNLHFDEEEEYLKRYYCFSEYDLKIKTLTEYYKFHNDIARLFMLPTTNVLNRYHDNKRRLEYMRITKMFKEEEENQGDKSAQDLKLKNYSISDKFLADLDVTDSRAESYRQAASKNERNSQPSNDKSPSTTASLKRASISKKLGFDNNVNKKEKIKGRPTEGSLRENSNSRTLIDLNNKLGEIINSRSYINETNYLESIDQTMTNLTSFLLFVNKKLPNKSEIKKGSNQGEKPIIPTRLQIKQENSARPETRLEYRVESREENREEMKQSASKVKGISPGDLVDRVLNQPPSKATTSVYSKITPRTHKEVENEKKKPEVKQLNLKKQKEEQVPAPKSDQPKISIKRFEDAVKTTVPTHQRKNTLQPSSSRENFRENPPLSNTLRYLEEARLSKQNSKPSDDKSQELRNSKILSKAPSSGNTIVKAKTKSIDLHTKITDLLIENNQPLLGNLLQKKEEIYQVLKNTNSSSNLKAKQNSKNEKDKVKGDFKSNLNTKMFGNLNQMIVQRAASDFIQAKTERDHEMKRIFTLENLDLVRRETPSGSLSARGGTTNLQAKNKEAEKNKSRGPLRARTPYQSDVERQNTKSNLTSNQQEDRKRTLHKSNKSENRIRKIDNFDKSDISNNSRPWLNDNNVRNKSGHKSPLKQNYMNNNEVQSAIPISTQNKRLEKSLTLKTERQAYKERVLDSRDDYMTKIIKARSPEAGAHFQTSRGGFQKTLELDFSPLRIPQRDNLLTTKARIMSSRTPSELSVERQQLRKSQNIESQRLKKK